jgi:hypothetical protein
MSVGGVVVGQAKQSEAYRAAASGWCESMSIYIQRGLEDCHCIRWPSGGSQCGY